MRAPTPNELPDPLDEIAREYSASQTEGVPSRHEEAIQRVRALSVWRQLRGKGRIELFRAACWLVVARPAMFTRADLEWSRDKRLEMADRLMVDAQDWGLLGYSDKERKLREAADEYYREFRQIAAVPADVERRRDPQAQACCTMLSRVCLTYFGERKPKDGIVATVANAVLDRRDITKSNVVHWRGKSSVKTPKKLR